MKTCGICGMADDTVTHRDVLGYECCDECAQLGDFASDDWIEGQALQAAGLPQLED